MSIQEVDDKRVKNRFGWVRRLMQGQGPRTSVNGATHGGLHPRQHYAPNKRPARYPRGEGNAEYEDGDGTEGDEDISVNTNDTETHADYYSDNVTTASYMDNVSTTPLKSIGSTPSTKSPSVLSGVIPHDNDNSLYVASTAETSITPTVTNSQALSHNLSYPSSQLSNPLSAAGSGAGGQDRASLQGASLSNVAPGGGSGGNSAATGPTGGPVDRDSESIVTLASSSRRLRRRSLDTNSSTAGIPPASIMERLSVNPTAANSTYAVSMYDRGSVYNNDRGSVYNNDRGSLNDAASTEQASEQMSRDN